MRILRDGEPADGNGPETTKPNQPAHQPEPPVTAKIVKQGKTERELLLERQNERLLKAARKLNDGKKSAEEKAALALRENQLLKEQQQQQAQKEKSKWLFFED